MELYIFHVLETLRKNSPIPFLRRECTKDWHIPDTEIVIPAGTVTMIPIHAIHHDPKYFPEPDKFLPERFQRQNSTSKTFVEMPYLPFGDGPRSCIGMRLGKMTTKIGLILALKDYSFKLSGNTLQSLKTNPKSFLLAPIGGLELEITKRLSKGI